jgi:hypothetical protein
MNSQRPRRTPAEQLLRLLDDFREEHYDDLSAGQLQEIADLLLSWGRAADLRATYRASLRWFPELPQEARHD